MHLRPWAIGIFLIVGFGLFTGILFLIGDRQKTFTRHVNLYTEFADIGGLGNGAKVRVSGFDAGRVRKIELPKTASGRFRLELEVDEKAHTMIRTNSLVSIETEGVVGDKFVLIRKGSDQAKEAPPGSTLPSKEPFDIAALVERGSGLLTDVQGTMKDVRGRVDIALDTLTKTVNHADTLITGVRPDINKIASNGNQITAKLDSLLTDVNAGKGSIGLFLKDETTRRQIQSTLANVQQASTNLDQASVRVNQTLADFQSRDLMAKVQTSLENVQALTQQLNVTMKEALAQDNLGEDGASNLRRTLSNLNSSTANLAEDTEALKHNFFLRGFFKKRGFYNLDQLSAAEYLDACDHRKIVGSRKWLQASTLITADSTGQEELSQAGRQQINDQVSSVVDSLPQQLIVIEGYSTGGSPDRQYLISRRRADLVRRYLEVHYHLKHSDVGVVPLRNTPPPNAGRDSWDGAAIVLLNVAGKK